MAFPIIKGGDVSTERLRSDRLNLTTFEIESGYGRSRIRGDLVYSIRGSIGEVAIVPDELEGANLTQDAARIAYTPATYGRRLLHVLKSAVVFAQLEAGALGATISGVNIRDLKRASIPVPPRAEQEAIAVFLEREISRIDALAARIRDAIDRLKGRVGIMNGVWRGGAPRGARREPDITARYRTSRIGARRHSCIHPDQVVVLNRVFTPDPAKVEYARRVVEAFDEGVRKGTASVNLDGKMVDVPVYKRALVILERARAVEATERRKAEALARRNG
jgi:hypothetical protein